MPDSKLIRLLSTFDASERLKLSEYIQSAAQENKKIRQLFQFINDRAPEYGFTPEEAFEALFKGKPFDPGSLRRLTSKLYRSVIQYLGMQEFLNDSFFQELSVLKYYSNRGMVDDFEIQLRRMEKMQKEQTVKDADFYYREFQIQQEISRLQSTRKDDGRGDVNFRAYSAALDRYYLLYKSILVCQKLNRRNVTNEIYPQLELEHRILGMLFDVYGEESGQAVTAWWNAIQLLSGTNLHGRYVALKSIMFQHPETFNAGDIQNFCIYLQNMAFQHYQGQAYYQELFDLYEFQIRQNVFEKNEYLLTPVFIVNMVIVALKLEKVDWAGYLVNDYLSRLSLEDDATLNFCRNLIDFEKGCFQEILARHQEYKLDHIALNITERRLLLKVYYELKSEYWISLEAGVQAFHVYLHRVQDKISDRQLEANRSFLHFLNRLYQLSQTLYPNPTVFQNLERDLNQAEALPEKDWLSGKLNTL